MDLFVSLMDLFVSLSVFVLGFVLGIAFKKRHEEPGAVPEIDKAGPRTTISYPYVVNLEIGIRLEKVSPDRGIISWIKGEDEEITASSFYQSVMEYLDSNTDIVEAPICGKSASVEVTPQNGWEFDPKLRDHITFSRNESGIAFKLSKSDKEEELK